PGEEDQAPVRRQPGEEMGAASGALAFQQEVEALPVERRAGERRLALGERQAGLEHPLLGGQQAGEVDGEARQPQGAAEGASGGCGRAASSNSSISRCCKRAAEAAKRERAASFSSKSRARRFSTRSTLGRRLVTSSWR